MVTATLNGAAELAAKVAQRRDLAVQVARASLYRFLLRVMRVAKSITPVATGRLRASEYVEIPTVSGTRVVVHAGFGTKYALAVHEDLAAHHEHGQAKFLELALQEYVPGAAAWFAADMKDGFAKGRAISVAVDDSMPTTAEAGDMASLQELANRENKRRGS